ncbi:hypothetical protein PVAND_015609 [Polypedilum vanderplanki]|uniref:Uncharacterized protein n=1 Tax=Polypedilum vanderplanki TaxID=319348 RepID=A0A9J6BDN4_POLVA|nr:hypothetical protein PVAND_015609 [Polypedilum vanderplanki]
MFKLQFTIFFITTSLIFKISANSNEIESSIRNDGNQTEIEEFYTEIYTQLMKDTNGFKYKVDCMIEKFREKNLGEKYWDLAENANRAHKEIQKHVDEVDFECGVIGFFQSPEGIVAVVVDFLLAFILIILCLKKND